MREEYGKFSGDVTTDTEVYGATEGEVRVASGVRFAVYGAMASRLTIEEGAEAEVYGTVVGPVVNHGTFRVEGLVLGEIRDVGPEARTSVQVPANARIHFHEPHPRAERARSLNQSLADTTIEDDLVINGSVHDVVVAEGVFVQVNGSAHGRVVISPGSEVRIHGSVHGSVTNRGRLDVYGTVDGAISDEGQGASEVHEGELIGLEGEDPA